MSLHDGDGSSPALHPASVSDPEDLCDDQESQPFDSEKLISRPDTPTLWNSESDFIKEVWKAYYVSDLLDCWRSQIYGPEVAAQSRRKFTPSPVRQNWQERVARGSEDEYLSTTDEEEYASNTDKDAEAAADRSQKKEYDDKDEKSNSQPTPLPPIDANLSGDYSPPKMQHRCPDCFELYRRNNNIPPFSPEHFAAFCAGCESPQSEPFDPNKLVSRPNPPVSQLTDPKVGRSVWSAYEESLQSDRGRPFRYGHEAAPQSRKKFTPSPMGRNWQELVARGSEDEYASNTDEDVEVGGNHSQTKSGGKSSLHSKQPTTFLPPTPTSMLQQSPSAISKPSDLQFVTVPAALSKQSFPHQSSTRQVHRPAKRKRSSIEDSSGDDTQDNVRSKRKVRRMRIRCSAVDREDADSESEHHASSKHDFRHAVQTGPDHAPRSTSFHKRDPSDIEDAESGAESLGIMGGERMFAVGNGQDSTAFGYHVEPLIDVGDTAVERDLVANLEEECRQWEPSMVSVSCGVDST